jgi:pimeloyl-ACP methyl ester carboxylesterase
VSAPAVMEPFRIAVPQRDIDDLHRRVRHTRWPDHVPSSGWTYGAELATMRALAEYWADGYDWRRHEAALNEIPQLTATVDGQRIHVLHARSKDPNALPLVITHGWPGSIAEFRHVIGPLVDPVAHGGNAEDAFHVVAPSLPGYGFSGPTTEPGWDIERTARAFAEVMGALGYTRYGAQGGDWGSMVARHLGRLDSGHVVGVHVNLLIGFPAGKPDDHQDVTAFERGLNARMDDYMTSGNGYVAIQSTRPQSLAYSLTDSPVGLLAWITEKFWAWTDHEGDFLSAVSRDDLLTNVSIYWFTGTGGSSARMYYESMRSGGVMPPPFRDVPLGVAMFPKEVLYTRRRWVEADYDITRWSEFDRGGHFAALEEPDLLVDDMRAFFRPLR